MKIININYIDGEIEFDMLIKVSKKQPWYKKLFSKSNEEYITYKNILGLWYYPYNESLVDENIAKKLDELYKKHTYDKLVDLKKKSNEKKER
jgi:heat shock protein HspQ